MTELHSFIDVTSQCLKSESVWIRSSKANSLKVQSLGIIPSDIVPVVQLKGKRVDRKLLSICSLCDFCQILVCRRAISATLRRKQFDEGEALVLFLPTSVGLRIGRWSERKQSIGLRGKLEQTIPRRCCDSVHLL